MPDFMSSMFFHFMSFGRSAPEIMSVICPIQNTVMGPSIKDEFKRGRGSSRMDTLAKIICFSNRKSGQRGGESIFAQKYPCVHF